MVVGWRDLPRNGGEGGGGGGHFCYVEIKIYWS